MKSLKNITGILSLLFLLLAASRDSAIGKIMDESDVHGEFYTAEITDNKGALTTTFLELVADGAGHLSYNRLNPAGGNGSFLYAVFDNGKVSTKEDGSPYYGSKKGAISENGEFLTLANMVNTTKGGLPDLLFAIRKSSGLTSAVLEGGYNLFLFYRTPGVGGSETNTNTGAFHTGAGGILSGEFVEDTNPFTRMAQPVSGNYEIAFSILNDGRLTLTLTTGASHDVFENFDGAVSGNGDVFVAVETGAADGALAFVIGIRQLSNPTISDIEGNYYVADFGYYPLDDPLVNDAADFLMNLSAGPDGVLSIIEEDTTCESCLINTNVVGSLNVSPAGDKFTATYANYPGGMKQGGEILLPPQGGVFALTNPLYLGIGIEKASGSAERGEPSANAGTDQAVYFGNMVTLDGSGSSDPDGTITSCNWQAIGGDADLIDAITLSDVTSIRPTFTAPNLSGNITFRLTVTDNDGNTDGDWVRIVIAGNNPGNNPPSADAGPDQTVNEGETVILNGSGSADPDDGINTYNWQQTGGPPVSLSDASAVQPTFIAPAVNSRIPLIFALTVADPGGITGSDSVTVTVNDITPGTIDPDTNGNGMPDALESTDSDLDSDGIADFNDPDSIRFRNINGDDVGFFTDSGTLSQVRNMSDTDAEVPRNNKPGGTCPCGVFSYSITGLTPGASVVVTFILPGPLDENATFFKIDGNGWREIVSERRGDNGLVLTLTDGDPLTDGDGLANGIIVDPSAVVVPATTPNNNNSDNGGGGGGGCFIGSLAE